MHFPLCGKSRLLPVFELAAADVHRTSAFQWVRVLHLIIIYRPPRMGQPIFWCERGDSIALWCKRRPAGVWQCPAGALHLSGFESPLALKNPNAPKGIRIFGAREGTRTPTGLPHAPQTCLSTIPTLSQVLGYCILFSLFCQSFFTGWDGRFSR